MAHFPLFLNLDGELVFLIGENARKEALLRSFGANVRVLDALTQADLSENPRLVVLTRGNRAEMAVLCRNRNIPVNSVDDPENCTFFFPAMIRRGDITIAISSGGTAPAAAKALRQNVEAGLPDGLEEILPWLSEVTAQLRRQIPDYPARAELLGRITREAFCKNRPLTAEELANL